MASEAAVGLSFARRLRIDALPAAFYLATALAALAAFGWFVQNRSENDVTYVMWAILLVGGAGVILGQIAAFLRLRTWLFLGLLVANHYLFLEIWDLAVAQGWDPSTAELFVTVPGGEREFFKLFAQLGALAAAGGFWSLTPRMEVLSCFLPTLFITSVLVAPLTPQEVHEIWSGTEKWQVWVQPALNWLCGWVIFLTVFLALAGRRRRQLEGRPAKAARGTSLAVAAFALLLCAVTALFGPYLVQTVPVEGQGTEEESPGEAGATEQGAPPPPQAGEGGSGAVPPPPTSPPPPGSAAEAGGGGEGAAGEGEGEAAPASSPVPRALGFLLLLLLLYFLYRLLRKGLRRNFIVHRLLEEGRPEPPTARLRRAWEVTALALREQGHEPVPAESPGDFVRRLKLAGEGAESLGPAKDCAELFDRARFGLFLGPEDPERARMAALTAYGEAWQPLSLRRRLQALVRASLLP